MTSVGIGERLRSARQALGLSLEEIESVTKIRRSYLDALEREAFGEIPGPAYVRGFLRAYARYLGIPSEDLLDLFPSAASGLVAQRESHLEVRITPATRMSPTRRIIAGVGVLLGVGVVVLGVVLYGQIRQFAESPEPQRGAPAPPARMPVAPSAGRAPSSVTPRASQAPSGSVPAHPPVSVPSGAGPVKPPVPPTPAHPGTGTPQGMAPGVGAAQVPGTPAGKAPGPAPASPSLQIVVAASGNSWVRTVADGTTVFEGFLNAGDKQVWRAGRTLTVRVGNAGAVSITLNGQPLGSLGGPGTVYEHTFTSSVPAR